MRTLRIASVIGSAAVLLLAGTAVLAEERPEAVAPKVNVSGENRVKPTAALKEVKQNAQERMQVVRVEAQTRVTALKEKAVQRVADIQDKKKQQIAERLTKQFENLNGTWTDHFMRLLDRYDAIMEKIRNRASIAAGNGRDVTAADAAIQSAEAAIETARTAVVAQAAKTYVLDTSVVIAATSVTTPSGQGELMKNLRASFQNLHKALFADLFALRDGPMKDARKAVQNALQTLGKVPGVDEGTVTSTAATSAQ